MRNNLLSEVYITEESSKPGSSTDLVNDTASAQAVTIGATTVGAATRGAATINATTTNAATAGTGSSNSASVVTGVLAPDSI